MLTDYESFTVIVSQSLGELLLETTVREMQRLNPGVSSSQRVLFFDAVDEACSKNSRKIQKEVSDGSLGADSKFTPPPQN